ncbi:hypothetical protein [Klebsiella michiganensis]|uniref:hypothetical protein n=1 Tax=Klebsiella michiganensis TaxID=1134687 RepID=UPI0022476331|nr:hypothetical protein [Klebsiella michiganensis]MCW9448618.1 hypothetical protein [Klebsiella michiganensis]
MSTLYRYDDAGLYIGEIEEEINPMHTFPDEIIDRGYYDEDGNPPIPPTVGVDERAVWIGYRYSIEHKYIQFENTTKISPGDAPEGKIFNGLGWEQPEI